MLNLRHPVLSPAKAFGFVRLFTKATLAEAAPNETKSIALSQRRNVRQRSSSGEVIGSRNPGKN